MSKRDDIITEIYNSQFVEKYISKLIKKSPIDYSIRDDIKSEVFLSICELPDERLIELYTTNKLLNYISGIIYREIYSKTSTIYMKYKRFLEKWDDERKI